MESQPQNPEFRINPETFTHAKVTASWERVKSLFCFFSFFKDLTYLHGHRLCSLHTPEGDLTHPCPA